MGHPHPLALHSRQHPKGQSCTGLPGWQNVMDTAACEALPCSAAQGGSLPPGLVSFPFSCRQHSRVVPKPLPSALNCNKSDPGHGASPESGRNKAGAHPSPSPEGKHRCRNPRAARARGRREQDYRKRQKRGRAAPGPHSRPGPSEGPPAPRPPKGRGKRAEASGLGQT